MKRSSMTPGHGAPWAALSHEAADAKSHGAMYKAAAICHEAIVTTMTPQATKQRTDHSNMPRSEANDISTKRNQQKKSNALHLAENPMLYIDRKIDESIVMTLPTGETITIMVTGIKDGQAKLGVSAPRHLEIERCEPDRKVKKKSNAPNGKSK